MTPKWVSKFQDHLEEPWKAVWSDVLGGLLVYDAQSHQQVVKRFFETKQQDVLEEQARGLMIVARERSEKSLWAVARVLSDDRVPVGDPYIEKRTFQVKPVVMFEWTDGVRRCVTWVLEHEDGVDFVCDYGEMGLTPDIDAAEIVRTWTARVTGSEDGTGPGDGPF